MLNIKRKGKVVRFAFRRNFDTCDPNDYLIEVRFITYANCAELMFNDNKCIDLYEISNFANSCQSIFE
jgi:hypothetical protein